MTIQSELLAIKGDDELLMPEKIVDWARKHPNSELHGKFQWDNRKAADEYRVWQARQIISIHLTYEEGERKFISLRIDRTRDGGGYRDLDDVKGVPDLMEHALRDALDEINRTQQRYNFLRELAPVWEAAKRVRGRPRRRAQQAKLSGVQSSGAQPSGA